MGHNLDLNEFGAPENVECPWCHAQTSTWYDDFDVDCCDPKKFVEMICSECEKEFKIRLEFTATVFIERK